MMDANQFASWEHIGKAICFRSEVHLKVHVQILVKKTDEKHAYTE